MFFLNPRNIFQDWPFSKSNHLLNLYTENYTHDTVFICVSVTAHFFFTSVSYMSSYMYTVIEHKWIMV